MVVMNISKIVYSEEGFFGPPAAFSLDLKRREFVCGVGNHRGATINWRPRVRVSESDMHAILGMVSECKFMRWRDVYDLEVTDGTQWELKLKSGRRVVKKVWGSNRWPRKWSAVSRLLAFFGAEDLFGPNAGDNVSVYDRSTHSSHDH